ncbi:MAG: rhamnulokinase family protein [Candidatus Thorarchaeota archaeon]
MSKFIAFDIGASSGRTIVGTLENNLIMLDEIYRFPNNRIKINKSLYWDILQLHKNILTGLKKYVEKYGSNVEGIGIDTWGVDFVLLDKNDEMIGYTYHYRDSRTQGVLEEIFKKVKKEEIFFETGIQFMDINSIVQLYSMVLNASHQLSNTETFLMVPDYLNFLLSGKKLTEYSIATTSQLFNPNKNEWAFSLIERLGFKSNWFQNVLPSGSVLGNIKDYIAKEVGLVNNTKVIAPACHDTGSAVAAVPVDMNKYSSGEWAYLSSGTWSLLGVELNRPLINDKVLKYNFTNEGGLNNSVRFLKNVTGMWIIQECKRIWENEGKQFTWEYIVSEAKKAPEFQYLIDPNNSIFLNPKNMIGAIQKFCEVHNQKIPESIGEISRAIFESLAFKYKEVVENLEDLVGNKIKILYIIGGGSSNELLNQFTANALGIPIKVGPVEATAIGNILIQAYALGEINSINEIRTIVLNSVDISTLSPYDSNEWETVYKIYKKLYKDST